MLWADLVAAMGRAWCVLGFHRGPDGQMLAIGLDGRRVTVCSRCGNTLS